MFRNTGMLSTMLNKRVEVWHREKSKTKDELGQYPVEDKLFGTFYAGIVPQTGKLLAGRVADTELARTTHKIVMRYNKNIKEDMWIMHEGVRYDIIYILDPYANHERIEVFCEVVV